MPIADYIDRRLAKDTMVCVTDVAAACEVTRDVVEDWISEGEIRAVDMGSCGEPDWRIDRGSVIEFLAKRVNKAEVGQSEGALPGLASRRD